MNLLKAKSTIINPLHLVVFLITILLSGTSIGQENPWESSPSGTNPWTGETEKETSNPVERTNPKITDSTISTIEVTQISSTHLTYQRKWECQAYGKNEYSAPAAMALSIATSSFFSIFAIPVNYLTCAIPTPQQQRVVDQYKEEHPNASRGELKEVKRGTVRKRTMNTGIGSLIGVGVNLIAILIIAFN